METITIEQLKSWLQKHVTFKEKCIDSEFDFDSYIEGYLRFNSVEDIINNIKLWIE